jgi:hypothetical protein
MKQFTALLGCTASLCAQDIIVSTGETVVNIPTRETVVNNHTLTPQEKLAFQRTYGVAPWVGRFWYDSISGLWGAEGGLTYGMMLPGHNYGPLSPRASAGNTGVFINGREINMVEAFFYYRLFGSVIPGRYWLDGRSGNIGREGTPFPILNLYAAYSRATAPSRGGATSKIGINGYVSTDGEGHGVIYDGVNKPVWTP